jgi:ppGpp synthetase/RelA/SpoT-type nucleotidyltranferase
MPLTPEIIDKSIERYWREIDRYAKLSEFVGEACRKLLEENVIRGSVQWRAKNPDRLRAKLQKHMARGDHRAEYTDLDSVFHVLKDLAGARGTTYVEEDRQKVVAMIQKRFNGLGTNDAVVADTKDQPGKFYRATHCIVRLKNEDLVGRYQNLKGLDCEVQICSLLAHVYNEIEHDLRYKPLTGTLSKAEDKLLDSLGHLMETGDTIINQTLNAATARQKMNTAEFEDEYDFVARMRPLFPQAENFATNAGQLYEVCSKLGLDSPDKLKAALTWTEDAPQRGQRRAQQLADAVNPNQDIQLEVDPLSSDQLLVLLLDTNGMVDRLKALYPSGRGVGRAPRFLSFAKHLQPLPR